MTDSERHNLTCDTDRASLHGTLADHEERLRVSEKAITELQVKMAIWGAAGGMLGGFLGKLL